jgi:TonB family protein
MKKQTNKNSFLLKPEYPGGNTALVDFIRKNLNYPQEAVKNRIEGKVFVEIEIDFLGNVTNAKVLNGIGYGCDEEALRVTKLLKYSSPKNKGFRVQIKRKINVHFKLPDENKSGIKYEITKKPIKKTEEKKPDSPTISYTIKW